MNDQEKTRLKELRFKDGLIEGENIELNALSLKEADALKADPGMVLSNDRS